MEKGLLYEGWIPVRVNLPNFDLVVDVVEFDYSGVVRYEAMRKRYIKKPCNKCAKWRWVDSKTGKRVSGISLWRYK